MGEMENKTVDKWVADLEGLVVFVTAVRLVDL